MLTYVRFPRVVLSAVVGAMLAISGATLQGIFRNPLADPGLIGVTAGAGLGATLWIVLIGSGALGVWGLPLAAFACGMLVTIGVWKIAASQGSVSTVTLLLAGIALNSFAGAGIGIMTFLADDEQLRSLTFWLLGGFGGATWPVVFITLPIAVIGMFVLLRLRRRVECDEFRGIRGLSSRRFNGIFETVGDFWCRADSRRGSIGGGRHWLRRARCAASHTADRWRRPSVCLTRLSGRRRDTARPR